MLVEPQNFIGSWSHLNNVINMIYKVYLKTQNLISLLRIFFDFFPTFFQKRQCKAVAFPCHQYLSQFLDFRSMTLSLKVRFQSSFVCPSKYIKTSLTSDSIQPAHPDISCQECIFEICVAKFSHA